jgi:hypothetical protein
VVGTSLAFEQQRKGKPFMTLRLASGAILLSLVATPSTADYVIDTDKAHASITFRINISVSAG